jgi:hypothetical protein
MIAQSSHVLRGSHAVHPRHRHVREYDMWPEFEKGVYGRLAVCALPNNRFGPVCWVATAFWDVRFGKRGDGG